MTYYPAKRRYEQKNIVKVMIGINRKTEPEILARIEREGNKAGYIKRLIMEDIERERSNR